MRRGLAAKIEAGTGLPSGLLLNRDCWPRLQASVTEWLSQCTAVQASCSLLKRSALSKRDAIAKLCSEEAAFLFDEPSHIGLFGVSLNDHAAAQIAGTRIGQSEDDIRRSSPLLVRLLCEQPVLSLWKLIAVAPQSLETQVPSVSTLPYNEQADDDAERCVHITFNAMINGWNGRIGLGFELDRFTVGLLQHNRRAKPVEVSNGIKSQISTLNLELKAVLDRLPMTIGQCSRFAVGDEISLAGAELSSVSIEADTIRGSSIVATGSVGEWRSRRAVRLDGPVNDNLRAEIEAATL